jgi:Hydrazine synthase alpha subunit middle domain
MILNINAFFPNSGWPRGLLSFWRTTTAGFCCLFLVACGGGGGSSGGSGGIDPLVEDFGIAYVRQPVPDTDDEDLRDPMAFHPGGDLIFRDLASPGASERNVTAAVTGGMGDVRDVEVSYDGSKLLFSLRLPEIEGADPEDQPTWNLWEYEIATDTLHRVIDSDIIAEDGQDIAPHYLPDGRIIFSSTRQRTARAMLTDEGKPQFSALDEDENGPAFVLHVIDARNPPVQTSDIQQVSFNQSHDLDPLVLADGEIMFSRWDNMGSRDGIHLYKMYPDGTNLRLVYGANSHATGTNGAIVDFTDVRETLDGSIMALLKQSTGSFQGGDIVTIDTADYVDNQQPTAVNNGILTGPAQVSAAFGQVTTDGTPSTGGRFNSFYPLDDGTGRILISWSQCRLMQNNRIVPCTAQLIADPNVVEAPPLYSVYLYDPASQTQVPIFTPREGVLYRDVVAAQPKALPPIHFDQQGPVTAGYDFDPLLVNEQVGILNIRSVYDFDGAYNALGGSKPDIATLADPQATTADERPARFLRIVKAVGIPDDTLVDLSGSDFGRSRQQLMREIIGYAPVEPDGSVRVKVPANIPFAISVLDRDGKRITGRHQNWLQLRPGEVMNCSGCHDANSGTSHGRVDAFASLNSGAPFDGYVFPNTETFFANAGETMAEARTRIDPTTLALSVDAHYADVWTDETASGRSKDTAFDYNYADLDATLTPPVSSACQSSWGPLCRIVINYETHIHPLWSLPRGTAGADTCTGCHTDTDAMMNPKIPDGQLDLTDGASDQNADQFKSYRELLFADNEQTIDMGSGLLVDLLVQATDGSGNPLFQTDNNGNLILDGMGNPIPVLVPVGVAPSMSAGGARASRRFFDMFTNAADPRNAVTNHVGFLTPEELKLLAEWLDIGAQYYNNPFDVPP